MSEKYESEATIQPSAASDEISLLDLLVVLIENAPLLIFGPLLAGVIALGYAFTITPSFTAATTILPPQQQQSATAMFAAQLGALSSIAGAAGLNLKNPADIYIALIKSRTVTDRIIDRFSLLQRYRTEFRQVARNSLATATNVTSSKDGIITIAVRDNDPKRAADMANAYVEELSRINDSFALTEAQQRRQFFEKQLKQSQENLKKAQLALGDAAVGESLIRSSPQAVVAAVANIKAQVTAQEVKLSTLRGYLTEQSPEFQMALRELSALRAQLVQAERSQPGKDEKQAGYINRYRDFKYHETLFDLMAKQYELARLDESREGAVIQVIDVAVPPELRSSPRRAVIAVLTTLVVSVLLLFFVFIRDALRSAQRNPESSAKLSRMASAFLRFWPRKS